METSPPIYSVKCQALLAELLVNFITEEWHFSSLKKYLGSAKDIRRGGPQMGLRTSGYSSSWTCYSSASFFWQEAVKSSCHSFLFKNHSSNFIQEMLGEAVTPGWKDKQILRISLLYQPSSQAESMQDTYLDLESEMFIGQISCHRLQPDTVKGVRNLYKTLYQSSKVNRKYLLL